MKYFDFSLSLAQKLDVVDAFRARLAEGLNAEQQEIKCLPTYLSLSEKKETHEAYVLDLGGSNLRAAFVNLKTGVISDILNRLMPWQRGHSFPKEQYLEEQARLLQSVEENKLAPLGYCFSYPASSESNGDARLLRWTKGVVVPDTEGELVAAPLLAYLDHKYRRHYSACAVVNDTVSSLLAGLTLSPVDAYAGLIVGTGMNMAGLMSSTQLGKLSEEWRERNCRLPVNLESGNFSPPHLTEFDARLDTTSENVGEQLFEKAVAGLYLGRLFALAYPAVSIDANAGAKGLVDFIRYSADRSLQQSALSLCRRSAQLVAAQIVGLALWYNEQGARSMRVTLEGGLAQAQITPAQAYANLLRESLNKLQEAVGLAMDIEFARIENANLFGAAVAATHL